MSRSLRRATTAEGRRAETAARLARKARASIRGRPEATPALDEARAEFHAVRPALVVETLEQRLQRHLPGAICFRDGRDWVVCRLSALARHDLAVCPSEREAIDVAITLWGAR